MGLIGGLNRGPKFPPRARRANARLALTDADQITVNGVITIPVIYSDEEDSTDLPASGENGQILMLNTDAGAKIQICVSTGGSNWYATTLTQMS